MSYIQASFRNITFNATKTNTLGGNRLVTHEMPLYNDVIVESLGSKNREFKINGFFAGDDWEKRRDDLFYACELTSPGLLVHPDFGEIYVYCKDISLDENKVEAGKFCEFELTFLQSGTQLGKLHPKTDTMVIVKSQAEDTAFSLADAFDGFYAILNLPQTAMDYAMSHLQTLTGVGNIQQFENVYNAITGLVNGGYPLPYQITETVSLFTSVYNNDYSDDGVQIILRSDLRGSTSDKLLNTPNRYVRVQTPYDQATNSISPQTAYNSLLKVVEKQLVNCDTNSNSQLKKNILGKRVELLVKGMALNESTIAAANMDFASINDAQEVWTRVITNFDALILTATSIGDTISQVALKKQKSVFKDDIQNRAPELNRIMYKVLDATTPTLVLSYRYYNVKPSDSRSSEIAARNKIENPNFAPEGVSLELLQE